MKKLGIVLLILTMAVAFAACSDSSDGDNEAKDRIAYVELGEMEEDVAYWDVVIKEKVDWEALGKDAQAETAIEGIIECVASEKTPSVDLCQVAGCHGEMGMPAFLWAVNQNDRIMLYGDDGKTVEEYMLTQEDLNRILDAKGFKLTEEWD